MTLEPIDDIRLYDIIKKNIPDSFIKIYNINKVTRSDI